ncbi:hypothetical protein [Sphingobium sp. CR28]|uniref:hypothetical protein n=1 Tax=Sphingobium sp. CR28 TaxID=3400272 RepID=UPI003FED52BE
MMDRLHNAVRRGAYVLQAEGLPSLAKKAVSRLRLIIGLPDGAQKAFLAQKASADSAYDGTNGTDTGGIQRIASLTVLGPNAQFAIDHIASDPGDFHRAMTLVDLSLESATFLDLGAGKGRAMLLAAAILFLGLSGSSSRGSFMTRRRRISRAPAMIRALRLSMAMRPKRYSPRGRW